MALRSINRAGMSAVMWLLTLVALLPTAAAQSDIENLSGHRQLCDGVYSANDMHGKLTPLINVTFPANVDTDGEIDVLIYPLKDLEHLGYLVPFEGGYLKQYVCTTEAAYDDLCEKSEIGKFVVSASAPQSVRDEVYSTLVKVGGDERPPPISYEVKSTGYYCVASQPAPGSQHMKYSVRVNFQNPFGQLPGSDYPLIPFHFGLCMAYVGLMLLWTVPLALYRHNVLKVQKYITALGYLMILEQLFVFLYYFVTNKQGPSSGSKALLGLVAFWSSARLAYTFFLLMLVAHGYSVVHPTLGSRMKWLRLLGAALFVTSFVYSLLSYYETNSDASTGVSLDFFAALAFFPLVGALIANYFMTLSALNGTISYLRSRKQTAKVAMYRYLSWILVGSALAVAGLLVIEILQIAMDSSKYMMEGYWKHKWLLGDGWPNIVYCIAFTLVMFLWRPNSDNKRYALSTQLAQSEGDAEEFEIGSLNGSDVEQDIGFERPFSPPLGDAPASHEPSAEPSAEPGVGAQRDTVFDADTNHELSDLEGGDEFEVEDHRPQDPEDDEDPLVSAPSGRLGSSRRGGRFKRK